MRKTWEILKDIINKNRNKKIQTQFKVNDDWTITDKTIVSEKFNDFFLMWDQLLQVKFRIKALNLSIILVKG